METLILENSREGRQKGTGNMCGQAKENRMRENGIKGGSMGMDSGQEPVVTHTLDSGKTVLHTDLEFR